MTIFTGTSGDDAFIGTTGGDDFHLEQGGDDTAKGGAGIDVFYMGAAFTGADKLDGGSARDFMVLDGDYSAGVSFVSGMFLNIETVSLTAGHAYTLNGLDLLGGIPAVDGSALGAGDQLVVNPAGGAMAMSVNGGAGDDVLTGGLGSDTLAGGGGANTLSGGGGKDLLSGGAGADLIEGGDKNDKIDGGGGADTLDGGAGGDHITAGGEPASIMGGTGDDQILFKTQFNRADHLDGGDGADTVQMNGGADGPLTLGGPDFVGIETLLLSGAAYDVTIQDDLAGAGAVFTVSSFAGLVRIDGSLETDARLDLTGSVLIGGEQADTLSGGNGDDSLDGGDGDDRLSGRRGFDTLAGGDGNDFIVAAHGRDSSDTLIGGLGADRLKAHTSADHFVYLDVADSTATASDRITGLGSGDVIDLSAIDADTTQVGDQAFHLVGALSGQAGELALVYDSFRGVTNLVGDVDGDGQADLVIALTGDQSGFSSFAL